jgi:hypothetical protein
MACVLGAAILFGVTVASASAQDLGPPAGVEAPGTRPDQTGKPPALPELVGKNGLVLMFVRSADWRPYCQAQLIDANDGVVEIAKRDYPRQRGSALALRRLVRPCAARA